MQELLITIVKGLVENPDAVSVTVDEVDDRGVVVYHLHVADLFQNLGIQPLGCCFCQGHPYCFCNKILIFVAACWATASFLMSVCCLYADAEYSEC